MLDIMAVRIRDPFISGVSSPIFTPRVPATTIIESGAERIRDIPRASRLPSPIKRERNKGKALLTKTINVRNSEKEIP